jgi:exonuclease SbcD
MKTLHIADIHAADKWLDECKKCCEAVLITAELETPDLIIIAGDVFDSRDIKMDSEACKYIFQFVHNLSEIAPVVIVTGTPSHEGHSTENLAFASAFEHNVVVSTAPGQLYLFKGQLMPMETIGADIRLGCTGKPDAIISMLPTVTKQWMQGTDDEISNALTPIFAGFGVGAADYSGPHILCYHGTIRGANLNNGQQMIGKDIEISKDQLALGNFDLVCCGHIHLPQQIGDNIFYSGSLFANNAGETHDHGFYVHELNPSKPSIEPVLNKFDRISRYIKTPAKKMLSVKIDMTDSTKTSSAPVNVKDAEIKVSIKVYQDEVSTVMEESIKHKFMSAGAASVEVNIIRVPRETVRSENLMKIDSLYGKLQEMARLRNETVPEGIEPLVTLIEESPEEEVISMITSGKLYA